MFKEEEQGQSWLLRGRIFMEMRGLSASLGGFVYTLACKWADSSRQLRASCKHSCRRCRHKCVEILSESVVGLNINLALGVLSNAKYTFIFLEKQAPKRCEQGRFKRPLANEFAPFGLRATKPACAGYDE